jgi:hypothetical protein
MTWIQTSTGLAYDLKNPQEEQIDIHDIAHSLAAINRFNGHTKYPYSVAMHSVLLSRMVAPEFAFEGLLHDAHEAYVGDVASPLKQCGLNGYRELEEISRLAVARKFGLPSDVSPEVREADLRMCLTEGMQLLGNPPPRPWNIPAPPYPDLLITAVHPEEAKRLFLQRFWHLTTT